MIVSIEIFEDNDRDFLQLQINQYLEGRNLLDVRVEFKVFYDPEMGVVYYALVTMFEGDGAES